MQPLQFLFFCARKSKDATQINSYQEKLLSGLKEKKHTTSVHEDKSDKSRERRQNEDCMVIEEFEN